MTITDNMAKFFAGYLIPVATQRVSTVEVINSVGNPVNVQIFGFGGGAMSANNGRMQIGKGTALVTRQDFKIEVPFTNGGIEDNSFSNSAGGYNSVLGEIQINGTLAPVLGAGTITEICKFCQWSGEILVFHDLVSPVGFIAGEQVNVLYSVLI